MANKFQKSVLERLEQEAQGKKRGEVKPEPALEKIPSVEHLPDVVGKPDALSPPSFPHISSFLHMEPVRQAKNKTFYLDIEVIEAVKTTAKTQGVTDSKLVNDILKSLLVGKR